MWYLLHVMSFVGGVTDLVPCDVRYGLVDSDHLAGRPVVPAQGIEDEVVMEPLVGDGAQGVLHVGRCADDGGEGCHPPSIDDQGGVVAFQLFHLILDILPVLEA